MTMNQFLVALAFNFLSNSLPLAGLIYLAIRLALSHGDFSFRKNSSREELYRGTQRDFVKENS